MKKFLCCYILAIFLSWMFQGNAFSASNTTPWALNVGLNPWIGNSLFFVANDQGFFKKENLTVKFTKYNDGSVAKQLLASGNIDVIATTLETPVILANAGLPVQVVGILDTSEGADGIIATKDIQTVSDLKGKTIAYESASAAEFILYYVLKKNHMTLADVNPVDLPASDAGAAFVAGRVDAAVTWEPWLSDASQRPGGHVLVDSRSIPLFSDFYILRKDTLQQKTAAVQAMLRALFEARDFTHTHPQESIAIIAKHYHLTTQETKRELGTFQWNSYKDNVFYFTTTSQPNVLSVLEDANTLYQQSGILDQTMNMQELVNPNLLLTLYKNTAAPAQKES